MKKILSILAIMMVAVVGRVSADDQITWTEVSNEEQFYTAIKNNHSANIKLKANVSLLKHVDDPYFGDITFTGRIEGNGFTIWSQTWDITMLFKKVSGASFSNLILQAFNRYPDGDTRGILTAHSENSTYYKVTVKNSGVWGYDERETQSVSEVGGLMAISHNDNISYCTIAGTVVLAAYTKVDDSNVGGFAGKAYNTVFSYCHSAADIRGWNNQCGGIAGYSSGCTFDRCLNTGPMKGNELTGGIVGHAENGTVITRCVNTGDIDFGSNWWWEYLGDRRGGIVGELVGSTSYMRQCLNFGAVYDCEDECGPLEGSTKDGATGSDGTNSYYYCYCEGKHQDNQSAYSSATNFRQSKMISGEYAYNSTVDEEPSGEKWLYQDFSGSIGTKFPVPIPCKTIYCNVLCDGTKQYSNSNTYQSTAAHTSDMDTDGRCKICGVYVKNITDAAGLTAFAETVNSGTDYSNYLVMLDNDIDLTGNTSFTRIGYTDHPFKGIFDGQGHRIKNWTAVHDDGGCHGLFGCVAGTNSIVKNVIIDSSCSITSNGNYSGTAGLIGCTQSTSGSVCNVTIENCGNEANVKGHENVAGILGGVYVNDNTIVSINNCYNTGNISGDTKTKSGSIVGYASKHTNICNTYNSGTVGGTTDWLTFAYTGADDFDGLIENCYTTVSGDKTNVTKITANKVTSGELCNKLNKISTVFSQKIGTDNYPIPGTAGLENIEVLHITTASELADFASAVNAGTKSSFAILYIDNDIDISSISAASSGYLFSTFTGTLNGNGHALKNSTHPLFYGTDGANIEDITLDGFKVTGNQTSLIARTSANSNFTNITVKNSYITASDNNNFGMIVGWSNSDNISYCTVESGCYITANRRQIGGIAGEAYNGRISYCRNSATITGDADYIGGIVGLIEDDQNKPASTIEYCVNTGTINGDDECGGIAGQYWNGTISHCVNTGTITSKDGDSHDNQGGIVGKLYSAICKNNINFGSVDKCKSQNSQFAIYGGCDGTYTATDNEYYCDVKGKHFDTGTSYDDIMSGKYALTKGWLYQDIDNHTYTVTAYPIPLEEAGVVYSNILCDGTQSYSNKYNSTEAHTSEIDLQGYCTICGNHTSAGELHIKTAAYLCEFANAVNNGTDYSNVIVYLDNSIDMGEVSNYTPIGTKDHQFKGTFDGQNFRIRKLTIKQEGQNKGLFGCVSGTNTVIKNVVIDGSCHIESTGATSDNGAAVAGLVGGVWANSGDECHVTIENCGNEADVKGFNNVAGILGGSFANDNNVITISNCYNTGTVTGTTESAAICGYARKNYTITNCYNSGSVTGVSNKNYLYYTNKTGGTTSVSGCYDVSGSQTGVTQITSDNVASGELCFWLNGNKAKGTWGHTSADAHPILSGKGMQHYSRTMSNLWGTICLPFAAKSSDSYDFYDISDESNGVLTLTKVTGTLAAGKPALIRRSGNTESIDVNAVSGTTFVENPVEGSSAKGLTLTGAFTATDITKKNGYIIANNAFWKISDIKGEDKVYCNPFRAYLDGTVSGARSLTIGEGIATGISEVLNGSDGEVYDLGGRHLNELQPGVNIIRMSNGTTRKVIIK